MSDIVMEMDYPHPIDRVWRALTDPELLSRWLMVTTDFRPEVGTRFMMKKGYDDGWRGWVEGRVEQAEPPNRLSYTWEWDSTLPETTVHWTLEETDAGTRLVLRHTGFADQPLLERVRGMLSGGWDGKLKADFPEVLEAH